MGEDKLKIVKIKRTKKEEQKLKTVRIKRIKDKPESLEKMRTVKIVKFDREYKKFLELGEAPDAFVENVTNKIAFLYMYSKHVGMDPSIIKSKLKDIDYINYMKIYIETTPQKLYMMGVYRKMHNGAIILLNLLVSINIEHDKKIKLPMSLIEFQNAIYRKSYYSKAHKADYDIEGLKRIMVVKDGMMLPIDDDDIEKGLDDLGDIKNCTVMVEYETCKFLSVPMKYFKKLLDIEEFTMTNFVVEDKENDEMRYSHSIDDLNDVDMEQDDYYDHLAYYVDFRRANGVIRLIDTILYYENFCHSLDDYNSSIQRGIYSSFERIDIYSKKQKKHIGYNYKDFINDYLSFIRL